MLNSNLIFRDACSDHLFGYPFVWRRSLSDSSEVRRTCIQLAWHQHWCCLWERSTMNVNTLQKPIISYRWRRRFCLAWKDEKTLTRKWTVDADTPPPNKMTKRIERRVTGSNVNSGLLSKLTHSKPTNNLKMNCWGIFS